MDCTIEEYRSVIIKIFDEFYNMLKSYNKRWIQFFYEDELPEELLTDEIETEEWNGTTLKFKTWKYAPSDITEKEMSEIEETIGISLPIPLKAYYTSYFHLFDWQRDIPENSPMSRMGSLCNSYNKYMISFGYLPFSWDCQGGCLYCMKLDKNNNDCGIYTIDHEVMFEFEYNQNADENKIKNSMEYFAENFCDYLKKVTVELFEKVIRWGI